MSDALLMVITTVLFPSLLLSNSAVLVAAAMIISTIRNIMPSVYNRGMRHLKMAFVHLLLALHYIFVPSKVVVTSNLSNIDSLDDLNGLFSTAQGSLKSGLRDLCISNHQTYVDWIYLWFFFWKIKREDELIIILKDSLRKVPIFGWVVSLNF